MEMASYLSGFFLFIAALALICVGAYSLRFREFPAATSFSAAMILGATWAVSYGMNLTSAGLVAKTFWFKVFLSITPFLPAAIAVIGVEYAGNNTWVTRKHIAAFFTIPILNLAFIWIDFLFPFARFNLLINPVREYSVILASFGSWGVIVIAYCYLVLFGTFVFLIDLLQKSHGSYFWQTLFWTISLMIPVSVDFLFNIFGISAIPGYNLAPSLLFLTAILNAWALYRYQWLAITPIARNIAVDQMSYAMLVLDINHNLVDYNLSAATLLQVNSSHLSRNIQTLIPQWTAIEAEIKPNESIHSELEVKHHETLTSFELFANRVNDQRGQSLGYVLTLRDITRRKTMEERLRQLSLAMEQNLSSVIITDSLGVIQYVNPKFTEQTGYSLDEARGKNMSLLKSGKTRNEVYAEMWASILAGKIWRGEILNRKKNGDLYWEETLISPVFDTEGNISNYLAIKEDVSERIRTSDDLQRRLKELKVINATSLAASQLDLNTLLAQTGKNLEEIFRVNSVFIAILNRGTNLVETPYWTVANKQICADPMAYSQGLTATVIKTAKPLLIEAGFAAQAQQFGPDLMLDRADGYPKTWLGVPIIENGETVGVISVQDYEREHAFSDDDIRLLETIGANIGTAIQNARLYENLQKELGERVEAEAEARRRVEQLTAINSIGRAITAGLDLSSVLTTLREQCQQISPTVDIFTVAMYDERTYKFSYLTFFDNGTTRTSKPRDVRGNEAGVTGKVITGNQTIYISDALSDEARQTYNIIHTAEPPARSYLGIPLLVDEKTIGVLSVQSYQPDAFQPEQIEILETVALQAAIALQNAKLFDETRRRMDELAVLYDVSVTLSSDLDLEQVMQKLLEICRRVLPMDAFYIGLFDSDTYMLSMPLFWDKGKYLRTGSRDIRITPGLSGEVLLSRKTIHVPDVLDEEASKKYQIIHVGGNPTRCYVGVPMLSHDQAVGVLSMQTDEADIYTTEHILLLETIASQAAIAIENSRLYRRSQEELSQRRTAQKSLEVANQSLHLQINRVEALQNELREQAIRDELTGLHNRRFLNETLHQRLDQAKELSQPISVLMIDIDRFKTFNDSYGHHAGDVLLQKLAVLLRQNTRPSDIICRYGGEEFIIALPDTSLEIANGRAENIRLKFEETILLFNKIELRGTVSIGVAGFPDHGTSVEEIIIQADQAMYAAKFEGRNKVVVWRNN